MAVLCADGAGGTCYMGDGDRSGPDRHSEQGPMGKGNLETQV